MKTRFFGFILISLLGIAFFSCAQFFQSSVDMENSNDVSLYHLLTSKETIEKLDAPTEINVSKALYSNKIEISWSPVKYANAYKVERAIVTSPNAEGNWVLPSTSDFEPINSNYEYTTSYTDTVVNSPTYSSQEFNYRYYYRVSAYNIVQGIEESAFFPDYEEVPVLDEEGLPLLDENNQKIVTVAADPECYGCLIAPPINVDATKGKSTDSITITWEKPSDIYEIYKYEIYRSEREDGLYTKYSEITSNENEFVDKISSSADKGVEFYYKVVALNRYGNCSPYSSFAMGYSLLEGAPVAPDNLRVEDGYGSSTSSLKVKWDASTGTGTITYKLYRKSSKDSVLISLTPSPIGSEEFEDTTVEPNIYYYYYVQTLETRDEETLKSPFTEDLAYGFLLSAPTNVEVLDSDEQGKVKIRWKNAINTLDKEDEVQFDYVVLCGEVKDNVNSDCGSVETKKDAIEGYSYQIVPKHNFYRVKTKNINLEICSEPSEVVAPVPNAPENVSASKTVSFDTAKSRASSHGVSVDEAEWVPNKNFVYPVIITWDAPDDTVFGYHVYRSEKPTSGFQMITDKNNPLSKETTCFVDAYGAAKSSKFYYYKVYSLNELGQGSKSNDPYTDEKHLSRGYGALTLDQWFREYDKNISSSQAKLTLMHKSSDLDKVGSETISGNISGTLGYNAKVVGLGAEISMPYTNYADHFIGDDPMLGIKFVLNGNTDTTSDMSGNGNMHEIVYCYSSVVDVTKPLGSAFEKCSDVSKKLVTTSGDTNYLVGMYPGKVNYKNLQIKGGAAGGGYYLVETYEAADGDNGLTSSKFGNVVMPEGSVSWSVGVN